MPKTKPGELSVVMKAKDLCRYVMTITQKTPKQFRFTFVTRVHNLSMDIIECIYLANEVFVGTGINAKMRAQKRLDYQFAALTKLKMLVYFVQLGAEQGAFLPKQFEYIAGLATECQHLLGGWIKNDRARYGS